MRSDSGTAKKWEALQHKRVNAANNRGDITRKIVAYDNM